MGRPILESTLLGAIIRVLAVATAFEPMSYCFFGFLAHCTGFDGGFFPDLLLQFEFCHDLFACWLVWFPVLELTFAAAVEDGFAGKAVTGCDCVTSMFTTTVFGFGRRRVGGRMRSRCSRSITTGRGRC